MKKCILYAEDDQDDFMLMKKAFEEIDPEIEIINVPNGYGVIKALQDLDNTCFPFIILMELNMPMLDGKETLELLKMDDRYKDIPIVFFSSSPSPSDMHFIQSRGLEFIHKPFRYAEWQNIAKKLAAYCYIILLCTCDMLMKSL